MNFFRTPNYGISNVWNNSNNSTYPGVPPISSIQNNELVQPVIKQEQSDVNTSSQPNQTVPHSLLSRQSSNPKTEPNELNKSPSTG